MESSGARMVEVGATNRTRLADYEAAITDETAIIFKAHKSNYTIGGFAEEVPVAELAGLAHDRGLVMVYDIGSGLLRNIEGSCLADEPDVRSALSDGADLVTFSGDKLLGGPQAGIVAGKRDLVKRLASAPLMRALRVGKLTLAALSAACRQYLNPGGPAAGTPAIGALARSREELDRLAALLTEELKKAGVLSRTVGSAGQPGGGALPDVRVESAAVEVTPQGDRGTRKQSFAERVFRNLLDSDPPVLGVLREGRLLLDVLALSEDEIAVLAGKVAEACGKEAGR
jgi:L-seryl-tRNA(Ser) seleniumtransferase